MPTSPTPIYGNKGTFFTNSRGQNIHQYIPSKDDNPRAICVMIHGVADHIYAYKSLAEDLWNKDSIFLCGYDQIGHGQSDGDKVDVLDFQHYVEDCIQFVQLIKENVPSLPIFLMGHSMGGLVVCQAVLKEKDLCDGVILYAASIVVNRKVITPFKITMAKVLSSILPKCPVGKIPDKYLCRDEKVVKEFQQDPLRWQGGLKARWGQRTLVALEDFESRMEEFNLPVLILHGDDDSVTHIDGSNQLYDRAASKDKTLIVYEGAYHRLHREPDGVGEKFLNDISEWMLSRSA